MDRYKTLYNKRKTDSIVLIIAFGEAVASLEK